ncbi:MAG: diguanylate cyclase [Acidobacteria bacterium]|nr:diguanylate cyclase [Acidobacteriota bacterium]
MTRLTILRRLLPVALFAFVPGWDGGAAALRPLDLSRLGLPAFRTFTASDGAPDTTVVSVATDAVGFVWLGSPQGLYRYDGHRWEPVRVPGLQGVVENLLLDHEGNLWAPSTSSALGRLDAAGWHIEGPESGLPAGRIFRVVEVPVRVGETETWALTLDAGLFQRVAGRWRADPGNRQLPPGCLNGLARTWEIGGRERLWVSTNNEGLWYRESGGAWQRFSAPGFTPAQVAQVQDLLTVRRRGVEELWIATYGAGLFRLTDEGIRNLADTEAGMETRIVYSLAAGAAPGGEPTLWAATRGGLVRVNGEQVQAFGRSHGLPSNAVRNVHLWRSPEGIEVLWLATEGGLARTVLGGSPWRTVSLLGSRSNGVFGVLAEPDGHGGERLWVASSGDGLGLYQDGQWRTFNSSNSTLPGSNSRLLVRAPDEKGQPTLFTAVVPGELVRVREGPVFETVPTPWPKEAGQHVMDVLSRFFDGARELWVATRKSGMYRFREGRWAAFPSSASERLQVTRIVASKDADDRSWLWATTSQGLARFDGTDWTFLGRGDGLPDIHLLGLTLIPDREGKPILWAGSLNSGIIRVDITDPLRPRVLPGDELPRPPVPTAYQAIRDPRGRVFVSTDAGVQLLTPKASGGWDERVFVRRDGLLHEECNTNAQFVDTLGRYWCGTMGGLSVYDPTGAVPEQHPKPLRLMRVQADGGEVAGAPVCIPSSTRELSFKVALLSWQRENENRFSWQLLGYDPHPGPWVETNERVFGALPPGRYLLQVKGRDAAGLETAPLEIPIEVLPAWWQHVGFRAGVMVLLVLSGAFLYRFRTRHLSRQKAALEKVVALRTAELAAANARLDQLSQQDPLTGIANRRRFDQALDEEWRRALRGREALGLLILDIDHFKQYNDALGHQAGDECLRLVAGAIADSHTRAGEITARYGGEEFAVIVPGANRESVLISAALVRRHVEALGLPHPASPVSPRVTVSIGAAWVKPDERAAPADLVAAADAALYRAKRDGRNCIRE